MAAVAIVNIMAIAKSTRVIAVTLVTAVIFFFIISTSRSHSIMFPIVSRLVLLKAALVGSGNTFGNNAPTRCGSPGR